MNRLHRLTLGIAMLSLCGCSAREFRLEATGASRALSRITAEASVELRPGVSPDGRTLLFDAIEDKSRVIVSVDPATGARRTIYTSSSSQSQEVAWGPDGAWFVYTTNAPGTWSLVRSRSSSPNAAISVMISGEAAPVASMPSVSPDGAKIAFATLIRRQWQIATANVDGSDFTLLGEGSDPEWSPDGKRLVFSRRVNNWWQVYTLDPVSGVDVVQVTAGEADNLYPTWSPDGRYVLFSSNRSARKAGRTGEEASIEKLKGPFNLFLITPDGTGLVQLTDGDGLNLHPQWGGDGWIYFSSNQAGRFNIWRLRPGEF